MTALEEHISEEHVINIFVDQHGDSLPMVDCHCSEENAGKLARNET